jgi:RNA polymerase sigma factor (sigma-70 family)
LTAKLKIAFEALTAHQREAIFLRFYQNLSYEEVAEVLNISIKATYKIMARSLSALKEKMFISVVLVLPILNSNYIF